MRKIVFALSVVLTVMTACEDNNDSTINGNRSAVPFSQIQLSEKVPMKRSTYSNHHSNLLIQSGTIDRIHYRTKLFGSRRTYVH